MKTEKDLLSVCKMLQSLLVHVEGDTKGNKLKTDIIKQCPDVREKLNEARQIVDYGNVIDYRAKHDELVEAILLWAKTPQNHGGNPYCHSFMKQVPWEDE